MVSPHGLCRIGCRGDRDAVPQRAADLRGSRSWRPSAQHDPWNHTKGCLLNGSHWPDVGSSRPGRVPAESSAPLQTRHQSGGHGGLGGRET